VTENPAKMGSDRKFWIHISSRDSFWIFARARANSSSS
jgi:hypothetical protein